ncbi:MAG TPA: class I adenylate-forming enzyme family protein [Brevibacillus sp.]|nr:class I adenylate-forming enzyme family protein [Brevibacillus sp.]
MGTLQYYLKNRAEETPDVTAFLSPIGDYSFKEYNERANQLAHYLQESGIKKGDRVGILCKNNHPYPTILMAILKVGGVAVPLNWRLTAYEMEKIIRIAEPRVVFYDEEFAPSLSLMKSEIEKLVSVGKKMNVTEEFAAIFQHYPSTEPTVDTLAEDDLALVLFTSGTTGMPKGCMIEHGTYDRIFNQFHRRLQSGRRFLAIHPLFHMSSTMNIIGSVYHGMTMVFITDTDSVSILNTIQEKKINMMFAFPSVYTYMLEEMNRKKWNLSSLAGVSAGGTAVPAGLIRQYLARGIPMIQGYGSTEASIISHWDPSMGQNTADSVGKIVDQVEIKFVHPDTGLEVATGEIGEVVVRSPYLFKGYLHNPEATQQVLRDGWLYTGDAGRIDENGFLYVSGRYKDMIVYGGDNVYPGEIEEVIHKIDGVLEVAVIGVPHPTMGEMARAYVIKNDHSPLTEADIIQECRKRLADYKVPQVVIVNHLPKNGLGKVMKHVLKEQASQADPVSMK